MAKVDVYNMEGAVTGSMELSDAIFGIEPNLDVLHIAVRNQLANKRQGTHSTKTRSEVRGGGRKPYRQKGTGRARHGSDRSAQYVGGGIIFGPKPRSYNYTIPKKVRRLAMKSALSSKLIGNNLVVVDAITLEEIKTKKIIGMLKALNVMNSAIMVLDDKNLNVEKSSRNIPGLKTARVNTINVLDLLKFEKMIVTKAAAEKIQEVYV
ncbi:MAG: 50S ribosomal protein L4 [Eubacteriales bacterium]|jgi:large subunit ribosomal protein L4|nr:50S ribosomal protein L4 [Eubacteriales bacterium]MDD4326649.1 50S ribosomal protein L4 [Eubacteriales bacterium]MDD4717009.1 50S ribosomal protein L4 [Eubacteriales bacterium]